MVAAAAAAAAAVGWDPAAGAFAAAVAVSVLLAAWRPGLLVGALLAASAVDLVLVADLGGFTFRAAQVAGVALAASAVARGGWRRWWAHLRSMPGLLPLAVLLLAAGARVAAGVPLRGKAVGYLAWAVFDVVVLAPAVAWHVRRAPLRALRTWWWGAATVAVFGLMQLALGVAGVDPPLVVQWNGARPRINALSYEPSYFAFQAMIPLALVFGVGLQRRLRVLHAVGAWVGPLLFAAIFLSSSRSGWLGLAVLCAVGAALLVAHPGPRRLDGPLPRVLATVAALAAPAAVFVPGHVVAADVALARKATDLQDISSTLPRREGVLEALLLFREQPLLGHGPGQFGAALLAHPELKRRPPLPGDDDPHTLVTFNLYAELLAETGAVGTLAFLAALWAVAARLFAARHRRALGAAALWPWLLMFGVMYQFNQTAWRTETWCLWGVAWALSPRRRAP
ncbi:MAG: O-antigen ligase family protein [Deltaproteobacteria bacterium]|nr:O-antigen ligase family protein [Deltaproteobacteria bacterium]